VIFGTMISGGIARVTVAYPRKFVAHRVLGWSLLAAVTVHVGAILVQHYKGWGMWQVAIPSVSGPLSRDLGVIAAWLLVVTLVLAILKKRIPTRPWHWIHRRLPFVLLASGTAHGLFAGGLDQGTELPVILPAAVALTFLASVCVVRANVTATRKRTRQPDRRRHARAPVPLSERFWPRALPRPSGFVGRGTHAARRPRRERQARSMKIMYVFASALCVTVLVLGADEFGASGFREFITRQGGVGATPDTRDCGHLSACDAPGLDGTSKRRLAATPPHRRKSRTRTPSASSPLGKSAVAARTPVTSRAEATGKSAAAEGRSSTEPTADHTTTTTTEGAAIPALRPEGRTTATTTFPPTTTTTTTPPTTTTTMLHAVSPTETRLPGGTPSARRAGQARSKRGSGDENSARRHASSS
jgi:hypothetical protein